MLTLGSSGVLRVGLIEKQSKEIKHVRGGQRLGAGRKAGTVNRSTKELRDLVRGAVDFTALVTKLNELAVEGNLQAIRLLLEYGYGRPQSVTDSHDWDNRQAIGIDVLG